MQSPKRKKKVPKLTKSRKVTANEKSCRENPELFVQKFLRFERKLNIEKSDTGFWMKIAEKRSIDRNNLEIKYKDLITKYKDLKLMYETEQKLANMYHESYMISLKSISKNAETYAILSKTIRDYIVGNEVKFKHKDLLNGVLIKPSEN